MTLPLLPNPKQQYFDANGNPLAGGKVYTYAAGTSTPKATYSDAAGVTPNANPVILDSRGEATIFWNGAYKVTLATAADATIYTVDNVTDTAAAGIASTLASLASTGGAALIGTSTGYTAQVELNNRPTSATLAASGGSALVGFLQAGTGASTRTVQAKLRERVSVLDFGADPTGVADSATAFGAARDYLATSSDYRGGIIYVPKGTYKLNSSWAFTPYVAGQVFNLEIEGDGPLATNLDFSGCTAGVNGITAIGQGVSFHMRGLSINGAPGKGLTFKGGSVGSSDYISFVSLENVRVQGSGSDGIYSENSFMVEMRQVWSKDNTGAGFNFQGFHTSIKADVCWATDNDDAGFRINGAIYFTLNSCGSDRNLYGYRLSNVTGVINGCGAESCVREGFAAETATSYNTGLPTDALNVYLTMIGCYAVSNSTAGVNAYANLLSCLTANSLAISVTMIGCVSREGTSTAHALALNAASGSIDIWGYTTMGTNADSTNVNTGGTIH